MKVLANLLFFVTLYLVYLVHERESAPTVALLVAASVIGVVGKIVQLKGRSCLTAYRDARARLIYERIANGEQVNGDTFLYLRPFHSTMNLTVSNPRAQSSGTLESLAEDRVVELESVLRTSLDPFGTLVGLGLPGESEGAGRILTTEENWRAAFQKLAEAARLLILLPSSRPGTLEEIIYLLRNGLLGKTLFIMPSNTMSAYDAKNEWTKTANTLSELGLHLPAYSAEGRILAFRANGEIFDSPMELSSKARLTPAISAAASWLGISLRRSPMSQQTHDTPLPAPVAFALYFMLSDLATTFLKLGSPWGQGLLGALFGLLISRFLPVDRFAFPVLIALLTVACDSLFGQVGRYTPSLYLYVLSNATTGMAIAFATALSLRRGEREPTDQPPWTLVSLGYALFPLISQWVSMLLGQLEQHVFGESREVPADAYYVYWFLVSLCASAAPGWLVARGLGADKIASESDPGPVVGVGSAALVALFVFGLGDSLMDLPRNRAIEIILAISTVASGCVAARYLYTEAAISKAKAVGISSIWLIAAAIAIAAWLLLAPEVGSPLDYERFPPPPPPPFGGDIGYYDNPSDFSLFYLAWSALGIGAACSLVSCLLMSPDILRAVKTATAVAVAFQVAAMLTLLLAGRNFGTLALGWGCCAYFCAQLMERFHRSERFLA